MMNWKQIFAFKNIVLRGGLIKVKSTKNISLILSKPKVNIVTTFFNDMLWVVKLFVLFLNNCPIIKSMSPILLIHDIIIIRMTLAE